MNRFFRSALFPLIIIVVLAYLAMNTLRGDDSKAQKVTYSELRSYIQTPGHNGIEAVVFDPRKQQITATQRIGDDEKKIVVNWATPDSQFDFEKLVRTQGIKYDSKGTGSSPWWGLLTALLPFVILIAFWIFLMNQVK